MGTSKFTPSSSKTSALPQALETALFPCFATVSPQDATTNAVALGSNKDAARTITPGTSGVVGSFKVTNGSAADADVIGDEAVVAKRAAGQLLGPG